MNTGTQIAKSTLIARVCAQLDFIVKHDIQADHPDRFEALCDILARASNVTTVGGADLITRQLESIHR